MNQAQLRPPRRVCQGTVAWLGIPAVLYLVLGMWWFPRLPELQQRYFKSFAKVSITPDMNGKISGHPKAFDRTLWCVMIQGRDMPAIAMETAGDLHPVAFQMTTADYLAWLQRFIYHATFAGLIKGPMITAGEILVVLFIAAWRMDRKRHLKFRSTPRHIRGSQLVSRAEFRRKIKGHGSGWLWHRLFVQWVLPIVIKVLMGILEWAVSHSKEQATGIGWRTQDFTEEVSR